MRCRPRAEQCMWSGRRVTGQSPTVRLPAQSPPAHAIAKLDVRLWQKTGGQFDGFSHGYLWLRALTAEIRHIRQSHSVAPPLNNDGMAKFEHPLVNPPLVTRAEGKSRLERPIVRRWGPESASCKNCREGGVMRNDRRRARVWTLVGAVILVCAVSAGSGQAQQAPPRPNIVVFLTDDQGYADLSSFGHPTINTPNIDRMAREGIRLTSFYAAPSCTPSRAQFLTGRYPVRSGELRADRPRLARRPAAEGDHDRAGVEGARLSDRDARQVAPRRFCEPAGIQSHVARIRLLFRIALLARLSAALRAGLAARSALPRPAGDRAAGRRVHADAAIHAGGPSLHPRVEQRSLLPVHRLQHAAPSGRRARELPGPLARRAIRRRHRGNRLECRAGSRRSQGLQPRSKHDHRLFQRQRPVGERHGTELPGNPDTVGRRVGRPAAGHQGDHLGGRRARPGNRALA